jgi:RTX calcium-binding nonapeptide repeat (4 copies)
MHTLRTAASAALLSCALTTVADARPNSGSQVQCQGRVADIAGSDGDDVLTGTPDADVIAGRGGADMIDGGGGADRVCGDDGNDQVAGGGGRDRVAGGGGNDRLIGASGNDILDGGTGSDRLFGGRGRDRLSGRDSKDRLLGGPNNDRLEGGGADTDVCDGQSGSDGGAGCETARSIALLRFEAVTLRRFPAGSLFCRLNAVIRNTGDEPATDVRVTGDMTTVLPPPQAQELDLQGPSEIDPNLDGPIFSQEQFFDDLQFQQGDVLRYVLRVRNGITSVDSTSNQVGILCTG